LILFQAPSELIYERDYLPVVLEIRVLIEAIKDFRPII
jgi:hypothetical protein